MINGIFYSVYDNKQIVYFKFDYLMAGRMDFIFFRRPDALRGYFDAQQTILYRHTRVSPGHDGMITKQLV